MAIDLEIGSQASLSFVVPPIERRFPRYLGYATGPTAGWRLPDPPAATAILYQIPLINRPYQKFYPRGIRRDWGGYDMISIDGWAHKSAVVDSWIAAQVA